MNILLVSKYDINQGGVASVLQALAAYLVSKTHRVVLLTHDPSCHIRSLALPQHVEPFTILKLDFGLAKLWPSIKYRAQFKKILKHFDIDLIHSHGLSRSELAYKLSRLADKPLLATSHGDLNHRDTYKPQRCLKIKKILKHATAVTHLTEPMAQKAHVILDTRHKSQIIHNGITVDAWPKQKKQDRHYIIAVGRFVPQKGFEHLIRTYAAACQENCSYGLVLLGDGPEKNNFYALATQLELQIKKHLPTEKAEARTIYFAGFMTGQAKQQALCHASLLCFPSQTDEAFSLVLLEAIAARLPVLASHFPMAEYLVKLGMSATLLPAHDLSAWQHALLDPQITDYKPQPQQTAEQFNLDSIHSQYEQLYLSLCKTSLKSL